MRKRNNFLEELSRKRRQSEQQSSKPLSEMSEAELDEELEKTKRGLRDVKEREVVIGRQEVSVDKHPLFFTKRHRKRRWK